MWLFNRKPPVLGNPERGLDRYAAAYRLHRIAEIAALTEKSQADAALLADRWIVQTISMRVGDGPDTAAYVPHPVWDDEWLLSRQQFSEREAAVAYVFSIGGELLVWHE